MKESSNGLKVILEHEGQHSNLWLLKTLLFDCMTYDEAHRAIKRGQLEALKAAIPSNIGANASSQFGWTLLMLGALEGNTTIGQFLIEQGADVAVLNDYGESALSLAAHKGHLPFVKLLKSHGASADVRPHGHDLESWLRNTSGLSPAKIGAILEVVSNSKRVHESRDLFE